MRLMPLVMTPSAFAAECRRIVESERGHAALRLLDLLTNDVLRALGYGDGIDIFETAVTHWHGDSPYPHHGPCPDCERTASIDPVKQSNE